MGIKDLNALKGITLEESDESASIILSFNKDQTEEETNEIKDFILELFSNNQNE